MSALVSLTRKELRMGFTAFIVPILAFILIVIIAFYIGNRNGYGWESVAGVSAFATGVQVFYLVYYLLSSLQAEKKRLHLWLHNPMSGSSLLFAKIVAGLISMFVTALVTGMTLFVSYQMSTTFQEHLQLTQMADLVFFASFHLFLLALSLAPLFLFFWMIFLVFSSRFGSFLSFLSTFVVFIVLSSVYSWFMDSTLYQLLTTWGAFQVDMLQGIGFNIDTTGAEVIPEAATLTLYAGTYLFETLLAILLFLGASWMLDKKVEV